MDIPTFYGKDSISDWQAVLGKELHYHFGHFESPDENLQSALQSAVRLFYSYIPQQSAILDIGCGWGGPAAMLAREKKCSVTCLSNTPAQVDFVHNVLGMTDVILTDVEHGIGSDGYWNVALLMESLEHIQNKAQLVSLLHDRADCLIIRTSATRVPEQEYLPAFGGSMLMTTQQSLVAMLQQAGWRIETIFDSRQASWPTLVHWKRNLNRHFKTQPPEGNFKSLNALCDLGIARKDWWIWSSPLLNIVAHR